MKKRFHANQRILSGLAFHFAIAFLMCSMAIAQQLAPNPNPSGDTITVTNTTTYNLEYFYNYGTIDNYGTVENWDFIYNFDTIYNSGTFNNESQIRSIDLYLNPTIDNSGTFNNQGDMEIWGTLFYNSDTLNNSGSISGGGSTIIDNSGTFNNVGSTGVSGYIDNSGTFNNVGSTGVNGGIDNCGTFNNVGSMSGDFDMHNMLTGTFNNQGYIDNDQFLNYGTLDNSGTFSPFGHLHNWGTVNNSATLAALTFNYGTFDNSANFNGAFMNNGTINNLGTLHADDSTNMLSGTINNSGTLINNSNFYGFQNEGTLRNLLGGTINISGTLTNTSGLFQNQGTLKGTGTFIGDLIIDMGTVAPGNSAGTMTVDGDFTLDGSGILDIEIGGFTPGSFDLLDITGTASMRDGNINFSFLDGYDIVTDIGPYQSKELQFLYADFIDIFESVITYDFLYSPSYFRYDVFQRENGLIFQATNLVPLPSAVILGSLGIGFASWKLRRRKEL